MAERLDLAATARDVFEDVPWRRYAALGDSVTEGMGDPVEGYPAGGWCRILADALQAVRGDLEYHNLGRRYLTTREIRETQLAPALELEPDLVTLLAGGNDLREPDLDLAATEAELERIVSAFTERGATVVTLTMFDIFKTDLLPPEGVAWLRPRLEGLHDAIRAVSSRHPVVLVDLALMNEGGDPGIYSKDLQHGNARAHFINAEAVLRHLAEHARSRVATASPGRRRTP